ncbi:MAG: TlpA disulfide reductase family protein [Bacteroidota bacterium]
MDRNVMLSSFRGKYVLIDFWASWCKPCRQENPKLVKTFQEYKDKNFTIVSVSLDNNKAAWLKAIRKDQLTWTHTSDLKFWKNEVALQYGVKTVPQNYLIDPTGKIIGKNIPSAELGKWLEKEGMR